jgi:kanamycin kinase
MEHWDATVAWALAPGRVTWRLTSPSGETAYLKVAPNDHAETLTAERDRMAWISSKLPAPRVLDFGHDKAQVWLLTAGLPGVNAIDPDLRTDPPKLVPLLGVALRQFHTLPVKTCPFDFRLAVSVHLAQQRVAAGLVIANTDLHREHAFSSAEAALERLLQLRPAEEDLVVCHGDFCLPNVLFDDGNVSGYLDLGALGVADRWWDLAVATWSVTWNLGPGWEGLFLDAYGIGPDEAKVTFYRLLYDLVP